MSLDNPSDPDRQNHPSIVSRNARYGMILFIPYLLVYTGFVVLTAFDQKLMAKPLLSGVNLAVVYGFGLIILAFLLALVYMYLCRSTDGKNGETP